MGQYFSNDELIEAIKAVIYSCDFLLTVKAIQIDFGKRIPTYFNNSHIDLSPLQPLQTGMLFIYGKAVVSIKIQGAFLVGACLQKYLIASALPCDF